MLCRLVDTVLANRQLFVLHQRNQTALSGLHIKGHDGDHEEIEQQFRHILGNPALPAREEKHGPVRRDGRWTLPHRLALRTAWCEVLLDLTSAVRSGPELIIEMRVHGGDVELVLTPGMVVDANELSVRYTKLAISRDADDDTPETLRVRLVGRMKHGRIAARWVAPRQ